MHTSLPRCCYIRCPPRPRRLARPAPRPPPLRAVAPWLAPGGTQTFRGAASAPPCTQSGAEGAEISHEATQEPVTGWPAQAQSRVPLATHSLRGEGVPARSSVSTSPLAAAALAVLPCASWPMVVRLAAAAGGGGVEADASARQHGVLCSSPHWQPQGSAVQRPLQPTQRPHPSASCARQRSGRGRWRTGTQPPRPPGHPRGPPGPARWAAPPEAAGWGPAGTRGAGGHRGCCRRTLEHTPAKTEAVQSAMPRSNASPAPAVACRPRCAAAPPATAGAAAAWAAPAGTLQWGRLGGVAGT